MRGCLLFPVMLWSLAASSISAAAEAAYRIGVLASGPKASVVAAFQPTADSLGRATYGRHFELVALSSAELTEAVAGRRIDFMLTSPDQFVDLQSRYRARGLASLVQTHGGVASAEVGGVIVVRSDRNDIAKLSDLRGKSIACAEINHLGCYLAQIGELADAGIDIRGDGKLESGRTPEQIVQAVASGQSSAGFLQTGVLESMAATSRLRIDAFRVLNPQRREGFPFLLSTKLYPDRVFAGLPHIPESVTKEVARALLAMRTVDGSPSWQGGLVEWTMPFGLESVHRLLHTLRLPPYEKSDQFDLRDVLRKYEFEAFILLAIALGILFKVLGKFRRLNNELAGQMMHSYQHNKDLQVEVAARQAAEQRLRLNASVFENSIEGIVVADPAGTIVDINRTFTRLTGYERADAIGKNPRFLKSGRHGQEFYVHMWASLIETGEWQGEIWNRREDGEVVAGMLRIAGIRDAAGKVTHYVGTFSDITVLKETQVRLSRAIYDATGWPE